jgi:hypothetical protein
VNQATLGPSAPRIFEDQAELRERIEQLSGRRVRGEVPIFEDTSSYMAIYGGCVLRLCGNDYFVLGDTREGRFGIDDQPKFWVKYALDLSDGSHKIIKLVFHEQFTTSFGDIPIRCRRNPYKESAFLDLVRGNPAFMQGYTVTDPAGNAVRIIDFIRGKSLYSVLAADTTPHEAYYHEQLPGVMSRLIDCVAAMAEVHRQGQHHGDIRNDHILVEASSGLYTWIDFDYEVNFSDYDVWSVGNLLTYTVGKGSHSFHHIRAHADEYPHLAGGLDEHDAVMLHKYRVANLRKLFPYVSRELNGILMRFSAGSIDFYEDLESEVADLRAVFGL